MKTRLISAIFLLSLLFAFPTFIAAQSSTLPPRPDSIRADKSSPNDDGPPLTTMEEEMRAKRAIKYAEKEHKENLDRANEIADLGKGLAASFKQKKALDRDDLKRLDRLEKLTKKVRSEAGGEDSESSLEKTPSDLASTVCQIGDISLSVSDKVKQTPRQVVSAEVIDEANKLLELIKLARTMIR
jgi:hypothetical protein